MLKFSETQEFKKNVQCSSSTFAVTNQIKKKFQHMKSDKTESFEVDLEFIWKGPINKIYNVYGI